MKFNDVLDVIPEAKTVLRSDSRGGYKVLELPDVAFAKFVYDYRRWLEAQKDPDDRVALFECRISSGVYCKDKEDRLIAIRSKNDTL